MCDSNDELIHELREQTFFTESEMSDAELLLITDKTFLRKEIELRLAVEKLRRSLKEEFNKLIRSIIWVFKIMWQMKRGE